ncbi:MAG TPA: hypothetical protein VEY10_18110 [Flavisolibacter sp.]|jgi:hypothetical protein|nr:hypothetical protein [Flavisolibacter sp.]
MKKVLFAVIIMTFVNTISNAQNSQTPSIKIKLKNSSLLPKRVTIITYQPGDSGNGTEQVTMLPKSKKELTYKEGTKIYLANSKQVDIVMSGRKIDQDKPFLVLKKGDAGKTFVY